MKSPEKILVAMVFSVLAAYWAYSLADSIINRTDYVMHLRNQIFTPALSAVLSWLLPAAYLTTVLLFAIDSRKRAGAWVSAGLFGLTAVYAAMVYGDMFSNPPCNCIGIVRNLSWGGHLLLNLGGVILSVIAGAVTCSKKGGNMSG